MPVTRRHCIRCNRTKVGNRFGESAVVCLACQRQQRPWTHTPQPGGTPERVAYIKEVIERGEWDTYLQWAIPRLVDDRLT